MAGRPTGRRAVLLGIAAATVVAAPTLAVTGTGSSSSFTWSLSEGSVSALSVEFVVDASDPDPTISYTVDVGTNRTDDDRAVAGGILWQGDTGLSSRFVFVNEDEAGAGASVLHVTASPEVVSVGDGRADAEVSSKESLSPEHRDQPYELTLLGPPSAAMDVKIVAPAGGKVTHVDRGPARLTSFEDFDSWTGVHGPMGTAVRFHEAANHDGDVVALANAGGFVGPGVHKQSVRTPEGCTASQASTDAVLVGSGSASGLECPDGVTEPRGGFVFDSFYYRGHEPGTFTWNGTFVRREDTRFTFLLTAELAND